MSSNDGGSQVPGPLEMRVPVDQAAVDVRMPARINHTRMVGQCIDRRKALGLSREELAKLMHTDVETINKFEQEGDITNDKIWLTTLVRALGGKLKAEFPPNPN